MTATIEVTAIEVLALKKLALVSHALAMSLTDKRAAREQLASPPSSPTSSSGLNPPPVLPMSRTPEAANDNRPPDDAPLRLRDAIQRM